MLGRQLEGAGWDVRVIRATAGYQWRRLLDELPLSQTWYRIIQRLTSCLAEKLLLMMACSWSFKVYTDTFVAWHDLIQCLAHIITAGPYQIWQVSLWEMTYFWPRGLLQASCEYSYLLISKVSTVDLWIHIRHRFAYSAIVPIRHELAA